MKTWTVAIKDIEEVPEKVVRGTVLGLFSKIVKRRPVDIGRFKGNWQITIDAPASGNLSRVDKSGNVVIAEAAAVLQRSSFPKRAYYITNNLPYAERLEYGWSKQAPNGMVRVTLGEYRNILELEAKKQ